MTEKLSRRRTAVIHHAPACSTELQRHITEQAADHGITVHVPETESQFHDALQDADIVLTKQWDNAYFEHAEDLQWVQSLTAGYDHYPLDAFQEQGIRFTNASGVHPKPIAEHVYGYLLGIERGLFQTQRERDDRTWNRCTPDEIHRKTMGIIGVGAIGKEIARKADAFDLTVHGLDPYPDPSFSHVDTWHDPGDLESLLDVADHVVLACPLTAETERMIGENELERMDDDAVLVNVGRGRLIDEAALVTALEQNVIRAAALDVFEEEPLPADSPLWDLENCVITPHNSGRSPQYGRRAADIFLENLDAFLNDRRMATEVYDLPEREQTVQESGQ